MNLRQNLYIKILCTGFAFFAVMALYWLWIGKIQLCLPRLFTGVPCPGCGLTRAAIAMIKGDFAGSFRMHPLLLPVVLTLLAVLADRFTGKNFLIRFKWFFIAMLVMLLLLYAVRMIMYFPDGPAPMEYDHDSLAGKLFRTIQKDHP